MTKKENFGALRFIVENFINDEIFADGGTLASTDKNGLLSFIDHEVELLSRKRSTSSKPTKTQKENEAVKEKILEAMANSENAMTATEVGKVLGLTPQKVSALMKQLIEAGKIEKTKDKKVTYFSLID